MTRIAVPVPVGARLADTDARIDLASATAMRARGFDGVLRYLETLTSEEIDICHSVKMGVVGVAYADDFDGDKHVRLANGCGLARGTSLCTDLESDHDAASVAYAHVDGCGARVIAGSFRSELYVGCDQPLDARTLYTLPNVHGYWRSASTGVVGVVGVPEPACGFKLYQCRGGVEITIPGVPFRVDLNVAEQDKRGRSMWWCIDA